MRVLVIPEDSVKDKYLLKPIIKALMGAVNKPRARVRICEDPRMCGIGQALNHQRIEEVVERYKGMTDLILLCVDRDCDENRRHKLDALELTAAEVLANPSKVFLATQAIEEVEVWALAAATDLPAKWSWKRIRSDRNPKERYFQPYVTQRGLMDDPGEGRKTLGREASAKYSRVKQFSPEVEELEGRVRSHLSE